MDEQELRDEIEAARSSRFPVDSLEQMKATLRDVYYKSINEEKILAVNGPASKKEAHIQNVLSANSAAELVEAEVVALEPTWTRPIDAIISLDESSLFLSDITSAPTVIGADGAFSNSLTVSGVPVLIDVEAVSMAPAWPVGSIFLSVVSTNPSTLLGFGTWAAVAAGRMLVGFDGSDPNFNAGEKIGGSNTATLVTANLPAHNHPVIDPGHNHPVTGGSSDDTSAPFTGIDAATTSSSALSAGIGNATTGITTGNTGTGTAFSVLNKYFTVFAWKRIA